MPRQSSPLIPRFLDKVEIAENGCWIWHGTKGYLGRGLFWFDGRPVAAHRFAYELWVGPIPEGMGLDHYVCDNGAGGCVNPDHLRPATQRENVLRGNTLAAANLAKTHCPVGHPYDEQNTVVHRGRRSCHECGRTRAREYQRRKRAV